MYHRDMDTRKHKARMGRPPLNPADRHCVRIGAKVTRGEQARLLAEAKRLGLSLSATLMRPWRDLWGSK